MNIWRMFAILTAGIAVLCWDTERYVWSVIWLWAAVNFFVVDAGYCRAKRYSRRVNDINEETF